MKKTLLCCLLTAAALLTGCEEKLVTPDPDAIGYTYYPMAVGDYRIYSVTDIRFANNVGDTTRYQLREVVEATFADQTNTLNYKIVRSTRPNEQSRWVEDSVLVVSLSKTSVLLTQDNSRYVKLVFPVKEGKSWIGDAYNARALGNNPDLAQQKELYTYTAVGAPFSKDSKTFDETVTVVQGIPTQNLVQLDDRKEVYAKGIGRVYRLFNRVVYCNDSESLTCPFGKDYKLYGHERHELLLAHGKE